MKGFQLPCDTSAGELPIKPPASANRDSVGLYTYNQKMETVSFTLSTAVKSRWRQQCLNRSADKHNIRTLFLFVCMYTDDAQNLISLEGQKEYPESLYMVTHIWRMKGESWKWGVVNFSRLYISSCGLVYCWLGTLGGPYLNKYVCAFLP